MSSQITIHAAKPTKTHNLLDMTMTPITGFDVAPTRRNEAQVLTFDELETIAAAGPLGEVMGSGAGGAVGGALGQARGLQIGMRFGMAAGSVGGLVGMAVGAAVGAGIGYLVARALDDI